MPAPRPIPQPAQEHAATYLETDEDVLAALKASLGRPPATPPAVTPAPASPAPAAGRAAPRETPPARSSVKMFRPTQRPAMAVLTIFDDGTTEGQDFRLRDGRFVIGRTEGDLTVPHDGLMSSRHVEITRQTVGGQARWVITDLQSTNGMFVRVLKTVLADRSEFLVGRGRYQFFSPSADGEKTTDYAPPAGRNATQGWGDDAAQTALPTLVELVGSSTTDRVALVKPEYWIGTDPSCALCRHNDSFCEPRHARVFRDEKGRWQIEHNKSLNGLWFRLPQVMAEGTVQFQLGEQRFRLRVGG